MIEFLLGAALSVGALVLLALLVVALLLTVKYAAYLFKGIKPSRVKRQHPYVMRGDEFSESN
ncbi:MAG: hypothetical protein DRQ39_03495 [Gammaproteobacteria bacterium]|nr:MAG: hypothetical protein DRQ39_03495 [Gammaproteobacteria bacterium]